MATTAITEEAIRLVQNLPEGSDWDDLMRVVYERIVVEKSRTDFAAGRKVSHEEARRSHALAT